MPTALTLRQQRFTPVPRQPAGHALLSTASESLVIGRIANHWHKSLSRDPPVKIGVPDPMSYESMLHPHWHGGWIHHHAHPPDAAAFPTLASRLFLLEATDRPVSLDGIAILPEPSAEPAAETPEKKPGEGDGKKTNEKKEELTEDDGLGKFEDLLTPDAQ